MKKIIICLLIFSFLFSVFFVITQPIFFGYEFKIPLKFPKSNAKILEKHVKFLSKSDRTTQDNQEKIVQYILKELKNYWINEPNIEIQKYNVWKKEYKNIIVHYRNNVKVFKKEKYIIWAHYDTFWNFSWADDNASGISGLLEIARILNLKKIEQTSWHDIDLVFYSTEEPPFFATKNMWSYVHAKSLKENENVKLVIILEMIGYFSEKNNSQDFPVSFLKYFYPTKWNFIAIISDIWNLFKVRNVKKRFKTYFKKNNLITAESINAPSFIPGIDFSDHRNYWKFDIPAIMITDTAFYRNKNYHTRFDTYEKLDYKKMKEIIDATIASILSF